MPLQRLLTRHVGDGGLTIAVGRALRHPLRTASTAPPHPPPPRSNRSAADAQESDARSLMMMTTGTCAVTSSAPPPPSSAPRTTTTATASSSDHLGSADASAASRPRAGPATDAAAIGKSKHGPHRSSLKVKKKAPWGVQQLRDSWSEDAMSKRDRDNMDERTHREYRYHPDEFRRNYIRYTTLLTLPCALIGMSLTYYFQTGRPVWTADPQFALNMLRYLDTSPRSKLYAYRLEDTHDLPDHVLEHRRAHAGQREHDERVFRLTHSAFQRPSEDELRMLELETQLQEAAAAAAAALEAAGEE